jgi:hypothetical protein
LNLAISTVPTQTTRNNYVKTKGMQKQNFEKRYETIA